MNRRTFMESAGALVGAVSSHHILTSSVNAAPGPGGPPVATPQERTRTLLVYFSRAGENYYYGDRIDLEIGNTEVIANIIASLIPVDVYRIEAAEPYSDDYDATVERNVREQNADARPAIADALPSVDDYDTILLGSGIWNVRPPMIMNTFVERVDLRGKTVLPFVTYAVSGLGSTLRVYTELSPEATFGEAFAARGELASEAGADVEAWLGRVGLMPR